MWREEESPLPTLPTSYSALNAKTRKLVRECYILLQNGDCYFCEFPLNEPPPKLILEYKINKKLFPRGFFNHPIHLQHNHKTDMTEGAVHCVCNAILFQYLGQ